MMAIIHLDDFVEFVKELVRAESNRPSELSQGNERQRNGTHSFDERKAERCDGGIAKESTPGNARGFHEASLMRTGHGCHRTLG